jgi:hypothetical protein
VERVAAGGAPLPIAGVAASLRVPRVFCHSESSRDVRWQVVSLSELGELVERRGPALVLRDVPKELKKARYRAGEELDTYHGNLTRIEETLWRDYELTHVDATYALFTPPRPGTPREVDVSRNEWDLSSAPLTAAPVNAEGLCRVMPDGGGTARTLVPAREGGTRASCEHTWQADTSALSASAPLEAEANDSALVLRLRTDYEVPLSVSVEVVQRSEQGVRRTTALLPPGTSYVPVRLTASAQGLSLVYRVKTRNAKEGQLVRLAPPILRAYPTAP